MSLYNKYALITGPTSGIGYELAKLFARDGYNLILVARSGDQLIKVSDELVRDFKVDVMPIKKDLFEASAAREIYEEVSARGIEIDALVNDAGQGQWGAFAETDLERDLDIIQLNISSLLALTKLFLPHMLARNEGKILQVGSEAGTAPIPLLAVYAATKAFVLSFSAALANELKDTNITVTALLPGATDTDFFHKAEQEGTVGYREDRLASPKDVAKDGYDALMRGENKIISGAKTKMHVWMNDLLGVEKSAGTNRKKMEPSTATKGRVFPGHKASKKEREHIMEQTGSSDGDLSEKKSNSL